MICAGVCAAVVVVGGGAYCAPQVLPEVLADRSTQVLVSLKKKYVIEFLVDILGVYPSQIVNYSERGGDDGDGDSDGNGNRGTDFCAKTLLIPAAVPCGHPPPTLLQR